MYTVPQRKGTSNFCQQVWQREVNIAPQHNSVSFRKHLFRERFRSAKNLYKYDLRAHFGCVNAIEFSRCGEYLASGGDDKRVLLWNVEKSIANVERPHVMATEHTSNIFSLGFDSKKERLLSGGNDDLVIVHDIQTSKMVASYKHESPVYGLSIDPTCDRVFATACEDGQILLYDQRLDPSDPFVIAELQTSFHAVEFHPISGRYLITANSKYGAAFWDIRKPNAPVIKYGYPHDPFSCMSVRFNSTGTLLLALRRRRPPVLYRSDNSEPVATFFHKQYYNSCTMKSCTFAGEDDELVLSGSDDFNLYAWHMNGINLEKRGQFIEKAHMVLYGHRSIVNQVRYNGPKCMLASSGVEKIVKLWSPFEQKGWCGSLITDVSAPENPRELYLPRLSTNAAPPHSWSHMSHDYSSRNTNEDPRMMAFFDSLIQQEIEGWEMTHFSTESDDDSNPATNNDSSGHTSRNSHRNHLSPSSSSSSRSSSRNTSSSTSSDDDNDDDDDDDDNKNSKFNKKSKKDNKNNITNNNENDGHLSISLSNALDDVPSAVEAQETEPCTESARRYTKHLRRNLGMMRRQNRRHRSNTPEYTNRIAFLIATKSHYLRRLAKRGMKRKPCTCLPNRVAKLKPLSEVLRPLVRPSFTQIIRIPASNNGNRMTNRSQSIGYVPNFQSSSSATNNSQHDEGRQLPARKLFRKYVPSPSPSSSNESFTSESSTRSTFSPSSSTTSYRNSVEDDLNNPVPSTSSRAKQPTTTSCTAMPSTSTGRTSSSVADIARLRQNQQMILVTDDDDESEDDNDGVASQAMSRNQRSRAQQIRDILPVKKLNGVRRLNDEHVGIRRSSRLMVAAAGGNNETNTHQVSRSESASDSTDEHNINLNGGVSGSSGSGNGGGGGNGRDQSEREQEPSSSNIMEEVHQADEDDDDEENNEDSTTISAPSARTSYAAVVAAIGSGRNRLRRSYAREMRNRESQNDFFTNSMSQSRWLYVTHSRRTNNLHSLHETEIRQSAPQACPMHGRQGDTSSTSEGCSCSQSAENNNEEATTSSQDVRTTAERKRRNRTTDETDVKKKTRRESETTLTPPPISPSDSDTSSTKVKETGGKCSENNRCAKHRKRKTKKERKDKGSARRKHDKKDRKHRCQSNSCDRDRNKAKQTSRNNSSNTNSSSTLSDDQPSTSAAALAARSTNSVTPDSSVCDSTAPGNSHERCGECGSIKSNNRVRRSAVGTTMAATTTTTTRPTTTENTNTNTSTDDDYIKKMERVKRVYAKYFESDSD